MPHIIHTQCLHRRTFDFTNTGNILLLPWKSFMNLIKAHSSAWRVETEQELRCYRSEGSRHLIVSYHASHASDLYERTTLCYWYWATFFTFLKHKLLHPPTRWMGILLSPLNSTYIWVFSFTSRISSLRGFNTIIKLLTNEIKTFFSAQELSCPRDKRSKKKNDKFLAIHSLVSNATSLPKCFTA